MYCILNVAPRAKYKLPLNAFDMRHTEKSCEQDNDKYRNQKKSNVQCAMIDHDCLQAPEKYICDIKFHFSLWKGRHKTQGKAYKKSTNHIQGTSICILNLILNSFLFEFIYFH